MRTFMYLDDDNYHVDKIRKPRIYYPEIGAENILEKMKEYDRVEYFTTVEGAIDWIETNGCPNFISFDNDLKRDLEGKDLAKWLVNKDLDEDGKFIPDDFEFFVHSQNIEAKKSIYSLLNEYLSFKEKEEKQELSRKKPLGL